MIYRGRRLIKTSFNSVIRQLFKEDVIFPWESKRLKSKIYINENFSDYKGGEFVIGKGTPVYLDNLFYCYQMNYLDFKKEK